MICRVTGEECTYLQQVEDRRGEFRDGLLKKLYPSDAQEMCEIYNNSMTMTDPAACGLAKAAIDQIILKKEVFDA